MNDFEEYGITLIPSDANDFYKYYIPDDEMMHCAMLGSEFLEAFLSSEDILSHHGIPGQKWYVRRYQNYDGTRIQNGTVFVSGSSKTQMKDSPYYRKSLPRDIQTSLDSYMRDNKKIVVGDAPGIDRQVQDYLAKKKYSNVEVYGPGKQVRYSANNSWKTNPIDSNYEEGSKEWLAQKDIIMSTVATEGLAVVLPEGSKATRKNIERLIADNKDVKVYELNVDSTKDRWSN